jgi:hypothetical protein
MALATTINLGIQGLLTGSGGLTSASTTPTSQIVKTIALNWLTGTAVDKADQVYAATRTLSSSTSETLDMAVR